MDCTTTADDVPHGVQRTESTETVMSKTSPPKERRRRNRIITSCIECRRRKLKCDKLYPCTNCHKGLRDCVFLAPCNPSFQNPNRAEGKTNDLKDCGNSGRRDQCRRRSHQSNESSTDLLSKNSTSEDNSSAAEEEKALEVTPWTVIDATCEDDSDDDMIDLGIRIGKMRMIERFSGLYRYKIAEEAEAILMNAEYDRRTVEEKASSTIPPLSDSDDYLGAGPAYVCPGTGFIFGNEDSKKCLMEFFPSKVTADLLVDRYFNNVHLVARVVHWPSFQSLYNEFWKALQAGQEPPNSQQALIISIMLAALVSMSREEINNIFGRSKHAILKQFQRGVELSLAKAKFFRTNKLDTLQALVIYLIPLCCDQVSRAHSVLVGTAVRLAECMGLHRDPACKYGLPPIECQIRRTIWHQLCCLDFRTGELQGPRPCIKREDYSTKVPININDVDLVSGKFEESNSQFTDMTLSKIRFECNEMRRILWYDRMKLEEGKIGLTHVLGKIESFREAMEAKYDPILDASVPIQHYTKTCLQLLLTRLHVKILHRFLRHDPNNIVPDRVRQFVLAKGTAQLEAAYELETTPTLQKWRWFNSFHQQWNTAFLMLIEVYIHPHRREADRIWKVLNFVFGLDPSQSPALRARIVINAVRERTKVYYERRKMRIPLGMRNESCREGYKLDTVNSQGSQPASALERRMSDLSLINALNTDRSPQESYSSWLNVAHLAQSMTQCLWNSESADSGFNLSNQSTNHAADRPLEEPRQNSRPLLSSQSTCDYMDFGNFDGNGESSQKCWSQPFDNQQLSTMPMQQSFSPHLTQQRDSQIGKTAFAQGSQKYNQFSSPTSQTRLSSSRTTSLDDVDMLGINWGEWDKIFPPDQNRGDLDMTPP